jgi:hypothetical protein
MRIGPGGWDNRRGAALYINYYTQALLIMAIYFPVRPLFLKNMRCLPYQYTKYRGGAGRGGLPVPLLAFLIIVLGAAIHTVSY